MCKQNNKVINKEFGEQRIRLLLYYAAKTDLICSHRGPEYCVLVSVYVCVNSLASEKLGKVNYMITKLKLG